MSSPATDPAAQPGPAPAPGGRPAQVAPPVLAEAVRSGFVEGLHRGSLVVLGPDGEAEWTLGDPGAPIFPRSSNKPMQAIGMLRAGLDLSGPRLALAAASHSGEPFHVELVETMLREHGLTEEQLHCPPDVPRDRAQADALVAAGVSPSRRVVMNCSGKHTAMLATCVANGWPLETYTDEDHPLQRLIRGTLEELAGEPVAHTGVDGCGAPLMAISLTGLARAFRAVNAAPATTPEGRVAEAMRAHPEYVGGTDRGDTLLMREVPGTLAKAGAEAVQAVALPDGRALAFKIEDGASRAVGPVLARVLERLGVDAPVVARLAASPLLGGGREVGGVRAVF